VNMNDLARLVARNEGKRVGVNIAQTAEILGVISDLFATMPGEMCKLFIAAGLRRSRAVLRQHKKAKRK